MDFDFDSDDDETEINDINQITAVLEDDIYSMSGPSSMQSESIQSLRSSVCNARDYSKIEEALALNKLTDEKYKKLENILCDRLRECRGKINDLQYVSSQTDGIDRYDSFRYLFCGKPYFKDKCGFPAPDNPDTLLMAKTNMYDFSQVQSVPGWTVRDKSAFTGILLTMSQKIKEQQLTSKIAELMRSIKIKDDKKINKQIKALCKERDNLKYKTLQDLALPINEEYDWDVIANKLGRRHNASEYRSLWKLFLHPSINKKSWTNKEHIDLQELAYKHNLQNWDLIAEELNNGRTGYQCFVYFRTNMSNTFTGHKWTKEEEEYLKRLIDYYKGEGFIPWGKVAASMDNRTKIQVYNKYSRLIEQRKGRFLPEEDAVLLTSVDNFGTDFKKIKEYLPGRSATQLRVRYQVLARKRISTVWTVEEDKKLLNMMANQDSTTNFSNISVHFPGKNRHTLRSRYTTLLKWMRTHPNADICKAPRRGARRLGHGNASDDLNKAVETLKHRIQSEVEIKKTKKVTEQSSEDVIEDAIIAALVNEKVREKEIKQPFMKEMLVIGDVVIPSQSLNVTNLKKLLVLLRSQLVKQRMQNSFYCDDYPGLLDDNGEVSLVHFKSYSKKANVKTISIHAVPNIWGMNLLPNVSHVMPPNYATITGCRKLMDYVSTRPPENNYNLGLLSRRNDYLKHQLNIFIDRFNFIFLWPMLLSNIGPVNQTIRNEIDLKDSEVNYDSSESNIE